MKVCGKNNGKKKVLFAGGIALLIIVLLGIVFSGREAENGILKDLRSKRGYIRTVEQAEYEFFKGLVVRNWSEELDEELLEQKTREKVNRVNAEFLLGNQMGLCGPYSFESFQLDLERENKLRKIKKQNQEIFYGPEEFDLITYYTYVSGNLKLDMVSFITENADQEILKGSKEYFHANKENYRSIEKINYLQTEDGVTTEKTLLYEDMSTLEKTDSQLFEFLYNGKASDQMEYRYMEKDRVIKIVSVEYEKLNYQNNIERVVRDYITNVYLEEWLQEIEERCPVEFNLS